MEFAGRFPDRAGLRFYCKPAEVGGKSFYRIRVKFVGTSEDAPKAWLEIIELARSVGVSA